MTHLPGIDKLARLMEVPVLQLIEPLRLAEGREDLTGSVQLCAMQGLKDKLYDYAGNISFRLHFGKDDQGVVFIQGEFSVNLKVRCQRCVQPMDLALNKKISIGIVFSKTDTENLPDRYEPLMLNDKHMSLEALLEEEVLLALPIAPVHEWDNCQASKLIEEHRPDKENPFAVLKNLKLDE